MSRPRWLNGEEQRTWRAFLTANQLLFEQLDHELQRDGGIPHAYYEILVRLSEAPGQTLRMSELAERSQSSRSRISHAVARLEEAGWVRRETCPTDRRGSLAVLTDEGMAALESAAPGHVAGVRRHLFDCLDADQVSQLRAISEAVGEHLVRFREEERAAGRCPTDVDGLADLVPAAAETSADAAGTGGRAGVGDALRPRPAAG